MTCKACIFKKSGQWRAAWTGGVSLGMMRSNIAAPALAKQGGRDIKAHSVVIDLVLSTSTARATPSDMRAINKVMDQLDALLVDVESDQPAIGSVEGYDRSKLGKLSLIISFPDANELMKKLRPFLAKLKWQNGFSVRKKYADYRELSDVFE